MSERFDKLGRRIPDFDRSTAAKKGVQTKKEKYGPDHFSRVASIAGRERTRGYFGKLKDEGKTEELKKLSQEGGKKSTHGFKQLKEKDPKKHREISAKGGKIKKLQPKI